MGEKKNPKVCLKLCGMYSAVTSLRNESRKTRAGHAAVISLVSFGIKARLCWFRVAGFLGIGVHTGSDSHLVGAVLPCAALKIRNEIVLDCAGVVRVFLFTFMFY